MKLEHIAYIAEIARSGSINRAAGRLLVSQPYLSAVLRELEEEFGVRLFVRHARGVTLTEAGREFLSLGGQIEAAMEKIKQLRETYSSRTAERLTVANIYSFTLLDVFREFSERHGGPGRSLAYMEMPNIEIIDAVYHNRATLGFFICGAVHEMSVRAELAAKGLCFQPLVEEPFCAVVSSAHPLAGRASISAAELAQYSFVVDRAKAEFHRGLFPAWFAGNAAPLTFDNNRSALYYLTKAPQCFSVGQRALNLTNPFVVSGALRYIPLADSPYPLITGYILRQGHDPAPLAQAFIAYTRSYFAHHAMRSPGV